MYKIAALISGGDLVNRRGLMNVALTRIEYLERFPEFQVETFAIKCERRQFSLKCLFLGEREISRLQLGGREITVLTRIEYQSNRRIYRKALKLFHIALRHRLSDWEWHKGFVKVFKGFDAISAHFIDAAIVAESAHQKYEIPFFVTWHGSDIHTIPLNDLAAKEKVQKAIKNAACNFFVSEALLVESNKLSGNGKKVVLNNGIDSRFFKYSESERKRLKRMYGIEDEKVVTFVGNLRSVKNVEILPEIFEGISVRYDGKVVFWVVGDGELRSELESGLEKSGLSFKMWGMQPAEKMPSIFNCSNVNILPSKNEGLGLVSLEAIACGANAVGSMVGGIPETIGEDYCVPLTGNFVDRFAALVTQLLEHPRVQKVDNRFNWATIAYKERSVYLDNLL